MPRNVKPPFGLEQAAVNKMLMLQRKDVEYDGFVKGGDLFDLHVGDYSSVEPDISPADAMKDGYEFDFHTHPLSSSGAPDLPRKIARREAMCAVELERARDETLSPNDAMFAMQYRSLLDNGHGRIKSLVIAPGTIVKYHLADPERYDRYKTNVGRSRIGANGKEITITESQVLDALDDKWTLIDTTLRSKIYERQDFSTCGDRDRIVARKKEWHEFLRNIGLTIDEKPVSFKTPRR
jgi:hypothetical protein